MKGKAANGAIIAMAFPDSFVKLSNEGISKITPLLGLGNRHGIKAGHAALCTVDYATGNVDYYDFGRYITPDGTGRVRSVRTDEELHVPIKAIINNNKISNLEEILLWLEEHPEKTHGEGRLIASVSEHINMNDAHRFIQAIHTRGSIPYGVFVQQGSNCARFVFDTITASCEDPRIIKALNTERIITPSPLGIVSRASSSGVVYQVSNGNISTRKPFSTIRSWQYLFEKPKPRKTPIFSCNVPGAQLLSGIGSQAYFTLNTTDIIGEYRINRYTENAAGDCENIFITQEDGFDPDKKYSFVYDSNCDHCHIEQNGIIFRFNKKTST